MQRIQVEKFLKTLRDLTIVKKLKKEGYSLNKRHVSGISKELTPEEVEALLRKRYSKSKGKSFFEVLYKNYKKVKEKSFTKYLSNKKIILIFICLIATFLLALTYFGYF